jgi:hypothetical protein
VTLEQICDFVASTGMSKVELRPDDVLQVRGARANEPRCFVAFTRAPLSQTPTQSKGQSPRIRRFEIRPNVALS